MSYIGVPPQATFSSGLLDRFTSTTGTTVTLTHDIASENDIVVFVNFVKQDSTTYSVGGTGNKTLTLGGTLVSSDIVEVHYLNIVGQTNAPSAGSVTTATINDLAVTGAKLNTDVISAQTELATAPASTDELLVSDAGVLKRVDVSLVGGDNTPAFKAKSASSQSITNNANNLVVLGTEVFDTDNAFSSNRFTVPSGEGGKYFFSAGAGTNSSIDDNRRHIIKLHKNGSEILDGYTSIRSPGSNANMSITMSCVLDLSASDYIELNFYTNNSDSGVELSGDARTFLTGFKLIGV